MLRQWIVHISENKGRELMTGQRVPGMGQDVFLILLQFFKCNSSGLSNC